MNDILLVNQDFDSRKFAYQRSYIYKIRLGNIRDDPLTKDLYWNIDPSQYLNKYNENQNSLLMIIII